MNWKLSDRTSFRLNRSISVCLWRGCKGQRPVSCFARQKGWWVCDSNWTLDSMGNLWACMLGPAFNHEILHHFHLNHSAQNMAQVLRLQPLFSAQNDMVIALDMRIMYCSRFSENGRIFAVFAVSRWFFRSLSHSSHQFLSRSSKPMYPWLIT